MGVVYGVADGDEELQDSGSAGDKIWPYTTRFGLTLLWIAAIFTLYTGYDYLRAAFRHARIES